MPQLQSLVLTDRAATPVDHTYTPRDISGGVGAVVESTGVPIGDRRFTISLSRTAQNRYKPSLKLTLPVVQDETINGVTRPTVVRTAYVEVNFSFDQTSSEQERKDAVGLIQSALDSDASLVNDTVVKLEGVY
jgi:hypothetical protein